jgi:pimeloyl-ACP methyl ester carboxylesterase
LAKPLHRVAADAVSEAPSLRRVRAGARMIAYREAGDAAAPAVLLLHGVGSGSSSWAAQLQDLSARGFRVLAWDAPGYGESDPLAAPAPTAADYADALAGFATALGLERFSLVGHSLGALMAASFCRRPKESRVARLVLASPAAGYGAMAEEARSRKTEERLAAMARLGPAGLAQERAAALLSPAASAAAVEKIRAVMRGLRPDGYAQAVRMLGQADIFADARRIILPTLVLCGGADTVTPEAGCRRVAAAIAGAIYESLPGLGHASYVEDPARFDAALLRFISGTDKS